MPSFSQSHYGMRAGKWFSFTAEFQDAGFVYWKATARRRGHPDVKLCGQLGSFSKTAPRLRVLRSIRYRLDLLP